MNKHNFWYVAAAVLLVGLGIYYFIFERMTYWWIILLFAGLFNTFLAWKYKNGRP